MSRAWYRGDCHVHTLLSTGGELTPAQVRHEAAGLDFIAVTEHNRVEPAWPRTDDLLVIAGQEVVTPEGHWLALGPGDWDRDARPSWVRLDRVLEVDEDGIRREGAVLDRPRFDRVAAILRRNYGWP